MSVRLSSLALNVVRLESLTYFLAGVIEPARRAVETGEVRCVSGDQNLFKKASEIEILCGMDDDN
jgi:hypothetical protein